jgi:protein-L-isoaspartate(D-aspartate) O-methyltransferase
MALSEKSRDAMIFSQLRTNEITHPALLEAMYTIPREKFVPDAFAGSAYVDEDIPFGGGRYLMEPLVFARLMQHLELQPEHKLLLVGAATGYAVAIASKLTPHIIAIESERELSNKARRNLQALKVKDVEIYTSALTVGYPMHAPYDAILIEGGVEIVPESLTDQLAEGGRLVTVQLQSSRLGESAGLGRIMTVHKLNGELYRQYHEEASVPLLPTFRAKAGFEF